MQFDFRKKADREFIGREILRFKASEKRRLMLLGEDYFAGRHDIVYRKRAVIGEAGELETARNLPDNKAVDNQYRKLVNQKANYILGQPLTFRAGDGDYRAKLAAVFDKGFMRMMKNVAKDAYNHGIAWIYLYYEKGALKFKRLKGCEIIPGWRDFEHTRLDYAIRIYETADCSGGDEKAVERAEVFDGAGVHYFRLDDDKPVSVPPYRASYITVAGNGFAREYNWEKIPLIAFKRDGDETPLISSVKSLQDGLNLILSNFWNAMEEDPRNTLLVLVNYDGEDLSEFRRNLAAYGAVKVRSVDGAAGDLKTLRVEVNADNYRAIIEIFKRAVIENGMGFDAKDSRVLGGGNPNQMNIQSMYSDIDLDANEIETEFQAALAETLWFVNRSLEHGGFAGSKNAEFIFNRDMMLNEGQIIDNCVKSLALLSEETVIANHPWADDISGEMRRKSARRIPPLDR
ncbi:MAG: phage portal protein [Oscillospiraceae bacterium]|jgi:SPP1 family phage portal protein|nr:phage portal protein [Oscillospiraceae bacterium]